MYIKCSEEYDPTTAFSNNSDRRLAAASTTTSIELLEIYSFDPVFLVRYRVTQNKNTPGDVLQDILDGQLDDEERKLVQLQVAKHPNALPETLAELSTSDSWTVRWRVAENPNTPTDVLLTLTNDPDLDVRTAATTSMYSRGAI